MHAGEPPVKASFICFHTPSNFRCRNSSVNQTLSQDQLGTKTGWGTIQNEDQKWVPEGLQKMMYVCVYVCVFVCASVSRIEDHVLKRQNVSVKGSSSKSDPKKGHRRRFDLAFLRCRRICGNRSNLILNVVFRSFGRDDLYVLFTRRRSTR